MRRPRWRSRRPSRRSRRPTATTMRTPAITAAQQMVGDLTGHVRRQDVDDPGGSRSKLDHVRDRCLTAPSSRCSTSRRSRPFLKNIATKVKPRAGVGDLPEGPQRADRRRRGRGATVASSIRRRPSAAIAAAIKARGTGAAAKPIEVELASVAPKLTTAQAVKRAPAHGAAGHLEDVVPGQRAQLLRREHLAAGRDHRRHRPLSGPAVRVVERARARSTRRAGYGPGGFIAGDHTEPTGALGGGHVLQLHDAVQRRAAGRPADGRPVESQVLHQSLSAGSRRHRVQDPQRQPDASASRTTRRARSSSGRSAIAPAVGAGSATRSGACRMVGR